jgi:glycosyltransferase involved in cell wall biosynthesis
MAWLQDHPEVELHTAVWAAGHHGTAPYDFGRLYDIGSAHERLLARGLRGFGFTRLGGGVAGRAVRRTVRNMPTDGVLYLSSVRAGAVLRYLPPGPRTVVTHVHVMDRLAEPSLPADRVATLVEQTAIWLAVDDETRTWVTDTWGVEADRVHVVPEPVDPASWTRSAHLTDPNQLRLALRGSTWFRRDHAARLVQLILRRRPELQLQLVWANPVASKHLGPVLHDLRQLDVYDRLELPATADELRALMVDVDVLAFTTPDDDVEWVMSEAGAAGIPMVCFDSHRSVGGVTAAGGVAVPYLDVAGMADAVLAFLDRQRSSVDESAVAKVDDLRNRDMSVIGPRLLSISQGGKPS